MRCESNLLFCRVNGKIETLDRVYTIPEGSECMGIFVNPDNSAFQVALNSEIYVDKTGLLEYTNKVMNTLQGYICNSRPGDSVNRLRQICLQPITAEVVIPKKCFPGWQSVSLPILKSI